ncbi:UbiA prenyltransferase family [Roridomyces roridus]|uniref:UbiA prenyltransferase family n=1 Tax=Roridomyces roridus TaxID=1738132 RepID=A0AAD7FH17_9AGAR|nr:UbiA prenyltransferase family [Roridomyces roridus]
MERDVTTDYKTVFFPVTAFACAAGPLHSTSHLVDGWIWIWMHLLMCNVSNQAASKEEDAKNRAWRPLPSGRVTKSQAFVLRWFTVGGCLLWSASYGAGILLISATLFATTFIYDEMGAAGHFIGKNFCNIGGYVAFESGATLIMGPRTGLDDNSQRALLLSGALIFTTIQAQDFADVEGDAASGRETFPIRAPELSRVVTFIALGFWSIFLSSAWSIGSTCRLVFISLGFYTGIHFYWWRTMETDRRSYLIFCIWLLIAHTLPLHIRSGALGF